MNINWQRRELNLKVVYYGPPMGGKTTNLEQIFARVDKERRSELVSLKTHEDRTLFFDFLQIELGKIFGLQPKIQLYTVPGQVYYEASRKVVLRGADGIVFVVDSDAKRLHENKISWENLDEQLTEFNIHRDNFPVVVQCNKQDLPRVFPPSFYKQYLSLNGHPLIPAVASKGEGVLDTLKMITKLVITKVQQEIQG